MGLDAHDDFQRTTTLSGVLDRFQVRCHLTQQDISRFDLCRGHLDLTNCMFDRRSTSMLDWIFSLHFSLTVVRRFRAAMIVCVCG